MINLKMIVLSFCLMIGGSLNAAEFKFDLDFVGTTASEAPMVFDFDFEQRAATAKGCGCRCPECICTADYCAGEKCPCKCGTCPCHAGKVLPKAVTNINVGAVPSPAYSVKICVNKAPKVTEPIEMTYSVQRQVYTVSPDYRNRWTWPGMTESSLRNHLVSFHGLSRTLVYSSNFGELKALHDEAHGTRVNRSYTKTVTVPTVRQARPVEMQAAVSQIIVSKSNPVTYSSSCPGGACPSPTTYYNTRPVYNTRTYRGYNYGRPTYRSSCPGGRCP